MSSISNPFFHSQTVPGQQSTVAGLCSLLLGGQQQGDAGAMGLLDCGGDCHRPKAGAGGGQCCVANPFTEEGSSQFESRMSQSAMDSLLSDCFQPPPASSMAAKLLLDSGYRSTTSNSSAIEEEIAAAERQRKADNRERRRQQQQRTSRQRQMAPNSGGSRTEEDLLLNSSVPAFLRRTCSSAANGITGGLAKSIRPPNWMGKAMNQQPAAPRRTRSVGSQQGGGTAAPALLYGTGWMVEAELSSGDDSPSVAAGGVDWRGGKDDCTVELGHRRLGILRLRDLLLSRYCFISGLKSDSGHPVLTFPDSRTSLDFDEYQLLLDYLFQTDRDEQMPCCSSQSQWVLVLDRRQDRWSSVRTLFTFLLNYFPEPIHLVFLLKPEGVLQRAIEYGYRGLLESCEKFKVLICTEDELHQFLGPNSLTTDIGGSAKHNHMEWATHRIDIERMKSSARVIAESLGEFGRCLRETELPNDVPSTERILELQQQERDAIKEDFRISIRKGMQLLKQVRQNDQSPLLNEQRSPSRLQNVTAIERMITQLQDTEKSFDTFWHKHRQRLHGCLELRRFEDEFRKLQNCFAKHMARLEEHREVGNSECSAERLASEHRDHQAGARADIESAKALRERGVELGRKELAELLNTPGSDSVGPKCEELARMGAVLEKALERRTNALELSRQMHAQIGKANDWCRRGVELLSIAPLDLLSAGCSNNLAIYEHALARLEEFLAEGERLKMDALVKAQQREEQSGPGGLLLLSSSEAPSLLAQVNERIDDIRRLSRARLETLCKLSADRRTQQQQQQQLAAADRSAAGREDRGPRPVQVVSPEKTAALAAMATQRNNRQQHLVGQQRQSSLDKARRSASPTAANGCFSLVRANSTSCSHCTSSAAGPMPNREKGGGSESPPAKVSYVLDELVATEANYVRELAEILCHYVQPFEALEVSGSSQIPATMRGQAEILFGNIRELHDFHHSLLLPALQQHWDSVEGISAVLSAQRHRLLSLYRSYCRNKPLSEALRAEHGVEQSKFFQECQRRAGHLLPLSAYLLKPVQRITKYQLLLKELIRHSPHDADREQSLCAVQSALGSMLDLLAQINADMEQLHILGYPGDLRLLGPLRLQTECEMLVFKRAKSANGSVGGGAPGVTTVGRRNGTKGKHQKRHIFLFDGGVLMCKKRVQAVQFASEYYEHKLCIPMGQLGFAEFSRQSEDRFDLWDVTDSSCYAIKPPDERTRAKWVQKLGRLTAVHHQQQQQKTFAQGMPDCQQQLVQLGRMFPQSPTGKTPRPQSWTTTSSSEDGTTTGGMNSVHFSRSSTSSGTAYEERSPTEMSKSAAEMNNIVPPEGELPQRSQSQPKPTAADEDSPPMQKKSQQPTSCRVDRA